jgi:HSP20 family protein
MAIDLWRPRFGLGRRGMSPFRAFDDPFSRMFEDWFSPRSGSERGWSPDVDMIDKQDEIVLRADVPGLEQKDLRVNVENGTLTIRGTRQEEREAKEDDYYCCERWSGAFARSIPLPPGVDQEQIKASFKNGVVEVHIPKSKQALGRNIDIETA